MNHGEEVERWVEENVPFISNPDGHTEVIRHRLDSGLGSFSVVLDDEIPHLYAELGMTDRISVESLLHFSARSAVQLLRCRAHR